MNIDDDILHIIRALLDQKGEDVEKSQSTIYSFYDRKRLESYPYYKNDNSVPKMVELGLLKVKQSGFNSKPIDTSTITRYFFYEIEFLSKKLKDHLKNGKGKKQPSAQDEFIDINTLPVCFNEKSKGYLKYSKYGQKIFIGDIKSRHYRFLRYMLDPFLIKTKKAIEIVFEEMRLPKDENDNELTKYSGYTHKKLELIQFSIKELQKDKKLHEKIEFELNSQKTFIKTVIIH